MSFTYAVIEHSQEYSEFYEELLAYIQQHFSTIESGIQGDAWIWVTDGDSKVELDTFYSMQFEVHSDSQSPLLVSVLELIQQKYTLRFYDQPIER